jgi:hypothetical protein
MRVFLDPRFWFPLGCLLVWAAYAPGLAGGFLLDDFENFTQLERYARGEVAWWGPIVSNGSGPLGRPISMASFVATVAAGGHVPKSYLLGNLGLHLAIGAMLGILVTLMARLDQRLARHAGAFGAGIALLWLALPIHVSTVLYPVQRMAQMSTLFLVLGLTMFVTLRARLAEVPGSRTTPWLLLAGISGLALIGGLAKENGLLLPLLCLGLELTLFARMGDGRALAMRIHTVTMGVPTVLAIVALVVAHDRLLGAYATRDFSLVERVLTQPRALWDYVGAILLPSGPKLGIYQDGFAPSRGILSPWTTLPAILGWLIVVAAAWMARRTAPLAAAGAALFLGGHALESSIFPLELYFEHRNYLPSIGVLLTIGGAVPALGSALGTPTAAFRRAISIAPAALAVVMLVAVWGRAGVWGSPDLLIAQSEATRPDSPRVQAAIAARAIEKGNTELALEAIARTEALSGPLERGSTMVWRLIAACRSGATVGAPLLSEVKSALQPVPTTFGLRAGIVLADEIEAGRCPGLPMAEALALYAHWLSILEVPPNRLAAWRLRHVAGRIAALAGDLPRARELANAAWADSNWNVGVGVFVVQLDNTLRDRGAAARSVAQLRATAPTWDYSAMEAIDRFERHLADPSAWNPAVD